MATAKQLMPVLSWVTVVDVGMWALWSCVQRSDGAGHRERGRVNCNLSHDKELFIRGLNWLVGQKGWREKFGGTGGGELSEAGAGPQTYDCIQIKTHPTMHHCPALLLTCGWTKKSKAEASPNRKKTNCLPPDVPLSACDRKYAGLHLFFTQFYIFIRSKAFQSGAAVSIKLINCSVHVGLSQ